MILMTICNHRSFLYTIRHRKYEQTNLKIVVIGTTLEDTFYNPYVYKDFLFILKYCPGRLQE